LQLDSIPRIGNKGLRIDIPALEATQPDTNIEKIEPLSSVSSIKDRVNQLWHTSPHHFRSASRLTDIEMLRRQQIVQKTINVMDSAKVPSTTGTKLPEGFGHLRI